MTKSRKPATPSVGILSRQLAATEVPIRCNTKQLAMGRGNKTSVQLRNCASRTRPGASSNGISSQEGSTTAGLRPIGGTSSRRTRGFLATLPLERQTPVCHPLPNRRRSRVRRTRPPRKPKVAPRTCRLWRSSTTTGNTPQVKSKADKLSTHLRSLVCPRSPIPLYRTKGNKCARSRGHRPNLPLRRLYRPQE